MENFIAQYFKEEKGGALILLVVSAIAISLGLYFAMKFTNPSFQGAGYPLVLMGIAELVIGATVYSRTDKQVAALQIQFKNEPFLFKEQEMIRMERVNRNFRIAKVIELVCIAASVLFMLFVSKNPFLIGIAAGVLFQGVFLLAFDTLAHQRGERYYSQLIK